MNRAAKIVAIAVSVLTYGQANYIMGFDTGTDTSLCVFSTMTLGERHSACDRVWANSPAVYGTKAWRVISGDSVPDEYYEARSFAAAKGGR